MPYKAKKEGSKYCVYKGSKKVGCTKGTKEAKNKYLAALHIADKEEEEETFDDLAAEILKSVYKDNEEKDLSYEEEV
tara:strand:+ start:326 stop:556 length:231 start_codon:yes stop_codon:yes gene_type:complete